MQLGRSGDYVVLIHGYTGSAEGNWFGTESPPRWQPTIAWSRWTAGINGRSDLTAISAATIPKLYIDLVGFINSHDQ